MMHRKPDDIANDSEQAHTALQVDTDSMTNSANQRAGLDLAAEESASLKNEFDENTIDSNPVSTQTMQSAETVTINTFQTSTADSTEFFQSSYYYIIEVRISLR